MSVLSKVYSAFSNLEGDYRRSRKTRREFVLDKFGGDIDIGAMIILDAVSNSECETSEDVQKLTFVRNIIAQIQSMKDSLDAVMDFSAFSSDATFTNFARVVEQSYINGTHQHAMSPYSFAKANRDTYHFVASPYGMDFIPFQRCPVVKAYNEHMGERIKQTYRVGGDCQHNSLYAVKNHVKCEEIAPSTAQKYMRQ